MVAPSNVKGMLLVFTATTIFCLLAVLVKSVQKQLPTFFLLQLRFGIQFLIGLSGLAALRLRPWTCKEDRKWLCLWGVNYWMYTMTYYWALKMLPLGDAITLVYLGPVFGAVVAKFMLGEQLPSTFVPCSALAILGGVLVSKPEFIFGGASSSGFAYCVAIVAAFFGGATGCISRAMTTQRHWLEVPTVGLGFGAMLFSPATIGVDTIALGHTAEYFVQWDLRLVLYIACIGCGGFVAIVLQTEGYRSSNYAVASMLAYAEIPLAYALELYVWGTAVSAVGATGAGFVIVAMAVSAYVNKRDLTAKVESSDSLKLPLPATTQDYTPVSHECSSAPVE